MRRRAKRAREMHKAGEPQVTDADTKPDWTRNCSVCGASPVVPITGMCGPCSFGEAETTDGDW